MTFAAAIAILSAGIACYVAVLSRQFSRAPGWSDMRWFSAAALAVSAYAALNVTSMSSLVSDEVLVLCSRMQLPIIALHSFAWLRYSSVAVGRPGARADRLLPPLLAAVAALGAFTPLFLPGGVRVHEFEPLHLAYRTAVPTPAGDAAYLLLLGALSLPLARFARAWRRGVPYAGLQFLALLGLTVLAVNDALVASGLYPAPYMVDVAFLLPIAAVGYAMTSRFVEDARAHRALRDDLERQVEERTAELGRAQEALHRAEKLAALGQFAAGVAHEVNNPASVVAANLSYLDESEGDALTEDGRDAVRESLRSVQRISAIVRQLLDAGRLAAAPEARGSVALRPLGDGAASVSRARFGKRVRVTNLVPEGLEASGHESVLTQVLANLVANAVQSVPDHRGDGHVVIRAESAGEKVRLHVDDNGTGMEPEVLRRAFEPFFTTKPFGSGTGLGLAVSRGLILSLGGDLRLESAPGKGTRATIELVRAEAPRAERDGRRLRLVTDAPPRRRLLVVDDESAVRSSLRRLLEPRYGVEVASGVDEALERVCAEEFDVVLCDVMMPGGGGERLYHTLLARSPSKARRVVFFTGGAVTDAARQFIHAQPQPVLTKPLDVDDLGRVAERMCGGAAVAAR